MGEPACFATLSKCSTPSRYEKWGKLRPDNPGARAVTGTRRRSASGYSTGEDLARLHRERLEKD